MSVLQTRLNVFHIRDTEQKQKKMEVENLQSNLSNWKKNSSVLCTGSVSEY